MSVSTLPRMRTPAPIGEPTYRHSAHSCPRCGTSCMTCADATSDAQSRIKELEAQVKLLTNKATAAVDKLADYEDQLRKLKNKQDNRQSLTPPQPHTLAASVSDSNLQHVVPEAPIPSKQSRLSNLLSRRSYNLMSPASIVTTQSEAELQAALQREQDLRQKAEGKLSKMNVEIEDLSVQLFSQANEMVAEERKARAKLEERVEILEKRDDDKKKRLDRLEVAMKRIDRVRDLLAP